jgi:hypothetical protein
MGMGGSAGLGAPAGGIGMPSASGTLGAQGAGSAGGQPWLTPWNPFANLEQSSAGGLAGGGGQGGSFGIIGQRGQPSTLGTAIGQAAPADTGGAKSPLAVNYLGRAGGKGGGS